MPPRFPNSGWKRFAVSGSEHQLLWRRLRPAARFGVSYGTLRSRTLTLPVTETNTSDSRDVKRPDSLTELLRLTEARIRELCEQLIATDGDGDEFHVLAELRAALKEQIETSRELAAMYPPDQDRRSN